MQSLVREQLQDDDTQGGFWRETAVKTANQLVKFIYENSHFWLERYNQCIDSNADTAP